MVICLERGATLSLLASLKYRMVKPFWCHLTQAVLEKRLLNLRLQQHRAYHLHSNSLFQVTLVSWIPLYAFAPPVSEE